MHIQGKLAILLAILAAPVTAQNLLDMDLTKWKAEVRTASLAWIKKTPTSIVWGPQFQGAQRDRGACSYRFQGRATSPHLLWIDAFGGVWTAETMYFALFELDGQGHRSRTVAKDEWIQNHPGVATRDVAQWRVDLEQGRNHEIEISSGTASFSTFETNHFLGAKLTPVQLPILLPRYLADWVAEVQFEPARNHRAPMFLVYASLTKLASPIKLPFGNIEIAMPLLVFSSDKLTYSPSSMRVMKLFHDAMLAGIYFQVAGFDQAAPVTTLRVGSATQTRRRIR